MSIKLYKDQHGYPRVDSAKSLEALGWFLEQDVQRSVSSCDEIIQIIESVQQGKLDFWEGTGNAHTVTIKPESVTIFNEFSDEITPCLITTSEFKDAVILWQEFIEVL